MARHGEARLLQLDQGGAEGLLVGDNPGGEGGALIVAPLHGRGGVTGVLQLRRTGPTARFEPWEFELVVLFAGHVSIALANAVAHQAVERRAMTDALTGLRNQGTFAEDLARAVALGEPFSLLILDLDDFKTLNDRHGHEAGNRLLRAIASSITDAVRANDMVYRYGGDEFALVLPGTTLTGALEVARKVGTAVGEVHGARISCSVGVAAFPTDGTDAPSLLLAADRACYLAKRSGRARAATARQARALEHDLVMPPRTPVDAVAEPALAG